MMKQKLNAALAGLVVLATSIAGAGNAQPAFADTAPPAGTPPTVSVDPLPTVQVNGVVLAQAIVGNTVYATGNFTKARPAGAAPGTNETTRSHLLAFDITTGNLIPGFDHRLNDQGRTIVASPDGKRIYVGGYFTTVDGQSRSRIAAFDTQTGALVPGFTNGPANGSVSALTATNDRVYVGGSFSSVVSGASRTRLAAYTSTGALTGWAPTADATVLSMIVAPARDKVIIGGAFSRLNSTTYYGLGAVAIDDGRSLPFASSSSTYPIRNSDPVNSSSAINSMSTNGSLIFITGYSNGDTFREGAFESRAAIRPSDGSIVWVNDCHGDSYGSIPIGGVLYSVTHAHECRPSGGFPATDPRTNWRALAETITVDGTNGPPTFGYRSFEGMPRSTQLNWYPRLDIGNHTRQYQAAWSITGNSNFISLGGEFPRVEGKAQEGLVRYAIASLAPNKMGPQFNDEFGIFLANDGQAGSDGNLVMRLRPAHDPDNAVMEYSLYRGASTTPIRTFKYDSRFWNLPDLYHTDVGLNPGWTYNYRLVAKDPFGNTATSYSLVDDRNSGFTYRGSGWTFSGNRPPDYAGGIHYTPNNGDSVEYSFRGTGIVVVSHRSTYEGRVAVSIDGGTPEIVNANSGSSTVAYKQAIFTKTHLPVGKHTIRITKVDGTNMVLDGIRIIS